MEVIIAQFGDLAVQIAVIIIGALFTQIGLKVSAAYNAKMATLKASEKNTMLVDTIERIVKAVQQQFSGAPGQAKLDAATKLVTDYISQHNIRLTEEEVRALIEAAVYGLKQGGSQMKQIGFQNEGGEAV